jgi:hypothetical protein
MKLKRQALSDHGLLLIHTNNEIYTTQRVQAKLNTEELINLAATMLDITPEELLQSQYTVEYWDN